MEFNRNQFFFLGMLILLIGIQVRMVEAYVLTPEATKFLAERSGQYEPNGGSPAQVLAGGVATSGWVSKTIRPPEWIGWCLMSIGAVLMLHSLAMPKPSG